MDMTIYLDMSLDASTFNQKKAQEETHLAYQHCPASNSLVFKSSKQVELTKVLSNDLGKSPPFLAKEIRALATSGNCLLVKRNREGNQKKAKPMFNPLK